MADTVNEYKFFFKTAMILVDEELEKYSIEQRLCIYRHENRGLKLAPHYSQQNCIFECKLAKVVEVCGCLPWYIDTVDQIPVCNLFGNKCYEQATIKSNEDLDFSNPDDPPCKCYRDCKVGTLERH